MSYNAQGNFIKENIEKFAETNNCKCKKTLLSGSGFGRIKGKIGKDLSLDHGFKAAERCGLGIVSHAKNACGGDLNKIKSCVKITGYVNSTDDFKDQPKVINGASNIISKIFDKKGEHTRAAISSNSLPLGVAVEIEAIFELI